MSRIIVPTNTLVGRKLISLNNAIIQVSQDAARLKAITDQITNNGAQAVNLESSPESSMPAGSGATLNSGISQIVTALNGLSSLVSVIDQG